ncbi:tRNA:m(4)X modification enzyme TRM13 homolog [Anomaloglossus baeobatrachus]|uniref:tRNA:m(4)X modification enzyme TRM13 homolog n=1 Tax=Anomaloglossus baeobatrachus TaxID=238106 RepID=UPI003F500586
MEEHSPLCAEPNRSTGPEPGRCAHYVQRKKRYCKMIPGKGRKYCGEHAETGEEQNNRIRILCPLDPKHTVYKDQLQKHLKKCNSREKPRPVFYVDNVNSASVTLETSGEQMSLSSLSKDDLKKLTDTLIRVTNGLEPPLPDRNSVIPALHGALNEPSGSILGHLDRLDLLGQSRCFVEFGAGRGKLSHWVNIATEDAENVHFLLVERATMRFKVDGKQRNSTFERLHIDIQHLCIDRVPSLVQKRLPVIGVGKHLCGAGTDLALRCLVRSCSNSDREPQSKRLRMDMENVEPSDHCNVRGIVIALCCHHRCDWQHYVGRDFFAELGLGQREFGFFQRMSSWATCGARNPSPTEEASGNGKSEDIEEHDMDQKNNDCNTESVQGLHLSVEEREHLGRLCKLLIDRGRVDYLKNMGYEANLEYYTEPEVSLENVLLTAVPTSAT